MKIMTIKNSVKYEAKLNNYQYAAAAAEEPCGAWKKKIYNS